MDNKKYNIGYTQGTYDLFHIGHLNLLRNAKKRCNYLIVGINDDQLVENYKNKKTIISDKERAEIVSALKVVDEVHIVNSLDKKVMHDKFKFDVIFIGDDWKGSERWKKTEEELAKLNVKVEYLEYTKHISTTYIRNKIKGENNTNGK